MLPQIFSNPNGGAITGEIRAFVGALPFGWLECNGGAFNASAYPRLRTVLGVATLPDLRGASLRGNDTENVAKTKSGSNSVTVAKTVGSVTGEWSITAGSYHIEEQTLDVRGLSYYVKYAVYAL